MLIRDLSDAEYFSAGDQTTLCELLHPGQHNVDLPYSIAHATLPPGGCSLPHRLRTSTEVYVILSGNGRMHIANEVAEVKAGQTLIIPPGAVQWLENTGETDIVFYALVSPPWRAEDEEVLESVTAGENG